MNLKNLTSMQIDLIQTHQARLFTDLDAIPAETELRLLKSVVDTLLLKAMNESLLHEESQVGLSSREPEFMAS